MNDLFFRFARATSTVVAHPYAFILAVLGVVVWAASGPAVRFSEVWQLWINTSTTILTFLMVFLLQHTQNRDSRATQLKLDELVRAMKGARNELIDIENLSEEEFRRYCTEFQELHLRYAKVVKKEGPRIDLKATVAEVTPEQKSSLRNPKSDKS